MAKKQASLSGSDSDGGEAADSDVYVMEDIVDYRIEEGVEEFRVKWKGYPMSEATWEPESNLLNPGDSLNRKMNAHRESHTARQNATSSSSRATKRRKTEVTPAAPSTRSSRATEVTTEVTPKIETSSPATKAAPTRKSQKAAPSRSSARTSSPVPVVEKKEPAPVREKTTTRASESSTRRASETTGKAAKASTLRKSRPNEKFVVVHISKDNQSTMKVAVNKAHAADDDESDLIWLPMAEARSDFKDELLDYLLERVRFREPKPSI